MNLYKEFYDQQNTTTYTLRFNASNKDGTVRMFRKKFNSDGSFIGLDDQNVTDGYNEWEIASSAAPIEQVGVYLISGSTESSVYITNFSIVKTYKT